ncbi:MAG: isoaspartyl peptidase/L-asparaginase family protein [Sphaerochaetaceae bacterium]|jgi:beta-aspartyl-peptidase (threonine type)|nr:isoaspartyl peptidase/L-asparaginase family protein [Sphaerochaetaceae bacterium]
MVGIIVHGGCHDLVPSQQERELTQNGISKYGQMGFEMLLAGIPSIDVVAKIISMMEDDPLFDAGTGSFKNLNGDVEMDAIIMNSEGDCGAVHCIQNVRNPIQVARAVMEKTPHSILSGLGAVQFARAMGFEEYDPSSQPSKYNFEATNGRLRTMHDVTYYKEEVRKDDKFFSTVGVVALDINQELAAGTSTGGIRNKMPGRVGDSAIPGAGTYCNKAIGLSATGEGEKILKMHLTLKAASDYQSTQDLTSALKESIEYASEIDCICGVIALTKEGELSFAHNGAFMPLYFNRQAL